MMCQGLNNEIKKVGNELVLALEDIMDSLLRKLDSKDIKEKATEVKDIINEFNKLVESNILSIKDATKLYFIDIQNYDEHYIDEKVTSWIIYNGNTTLDGLYDMCYKLRELIRTLE